MVLIHLLASALLSLAWHHQKVSFVVAALKLLYFLQKVHLSMVQASSHQTKTYLAMLLQFNQIIRQMAWLWR